MVIIKKGYIFNKQYGVFDNYVNELYKIKTSDNKPELKSISKLLLNSLLGRFGLQLDKTITEIVNNERYENIISSCEVFSEISIYQDNTLITYKNEINLDNVEQLKLDINKNWAKNFL